MSENAGIIVVYAALLEINREQTSKHHYLLVTGFHLQLMVIYHHGNALL